MADLFESKQQLAAALAETGYRTFGYVPDKVEPPILIVQAGEEYVREGDTFDRARFDCKLDLYLLVAPRANERTTKDLDVMIGRTLTHLPVEWVVEGADRPDYLTAHDWLAYGIRIKLAGSFNIDGSE